MYRHLFNGKTKSKNLLLFSQRAITFLSPFYFILHGILYCFIRTHWFNNVCLKKLNGIFFKVIVLFLIHIMAFLMHIIAFLGSVVSHYCSISVLTLNFSKRNIFYQIKASFEAQIMICICRSSSILVRHFIQWRFWGTVNVCSISIYQLSMYIVFNS